MLSGACLDASTGMYERRLVRDRVYFGVGRIVFLAFSRDETKMGFGLPKEEREGLVAAEPENKFMPRPSDMRYHLVECGAGKVV